MDVNVKARDLQEQAAKTGHLPEFGNGHRREDWPDPLIAPYELTPDQLDFLQSQVAGHRWHVGRCLSGDGDFSAAWAKTRASAQSAETAQLKIERAPELRKAIFADPAALAVIAEEVAWNHQDPETRHPGGTAESRRMVGVVSETAGTARQAERMSRH